MNKLRAFAEKSDTLLATIATPCFLKSVCWPFFLLKTLYIRHKRFDYKNVRIIFQKVFIAVLLIISLKRNTFWLVSPVIIKNLSAKAKKRLTTCVQINKSCLKPEQKI